MSASSEKNQQSEALEFIATWSQAFTHVLTQIAASAFDVTVAAAPPNPEDANQLWFTISASGGLAGEMAMHLHTRDAIALAQFFVGEAPAHAEFNQEHEETLEELLRQVAGIAATALEPQHREVLLRLQRAERPSWTPAAIGSLVSAGGSPCSFEIFYQLSPALLAALGSAEPPQSCPPSTGNQFELVKDVALNVTLRFGAREMLLREILELCAGSIIELDRTIDEPAELLLDGRTIASGEVVVVQGNYGLRLTKVPPAVSGREA